MICRNEVLAIIDTLLCLFVIFPLSILHWRGTWQLQDVYFCPDDEVTSAWISLTIGANVCLLELFLQPSLAELITPYGPWVYVPVSRLHLYIHGWAVLCYWRGLWNLLDLYLTAHWINAVITYGVCQTIMVLTKTVRTGVGVPVALQLDVDPNLLEPDTVYKTPPSQLSRFVLDCCFSQFVIVTSNIVIWRGIWNICDEFIFPHFPDWSEFVSLGAGFSGVAVFFMLEVPMAWISRRLDKCWYAKLAFEDFLFLVLTWANLLLWRGAWNLCMDHFLPEPVLGGWVSHVIGTVGLMAVQAFNTVGLHGIVRDGSFSNGEGVYDTKYLRILFPPSTDKASSEEKSHTVQVSQYDTPNVKSFDDKSCLLTTSDGDSADDELSVVGE